MLPEPSIDPRRYGLTALRPDSMSADPKKAALELLGGAAKIERPAPPSGISLLSLRAGASSKKRR